MTILTVEQFREHVTSGLGNAAIQRLLDSAEAEIVRYAGEPGDVTEMIDGRGRFVTLNHQAASITSVSELRYGTSTVLAADDYLLRPSGVVLERLPYGTHSHHEWRGRVTVVYSPVDDSALRETVQIDLVNLALNFSPGAVMEQIGSWTEQFGQAVATNRQEADSILSRLDVGPQIRVVA